MDPHDEAFEAHRPLLFSIAYRMLGSAMDAEDVVQEAYVRWRSADADAVRSPKAFLTTVVTRLAINELKSARARRETYVGPWLPEPLLGEAWVSDDGPSGARETLSLAFLLLLERLTPAERAVFVLREAFDTPFDEIARILGKSETACRQLLSRARRHVSAGRARFAAPAAARSELMRRFGEAASTGDLSALREMLAEDAVLLSDGGGKVSAARNPVYGAEHVARFVAGLARKLAQAAAPPRLVPVSVNGAPGLVVHVPGEASSVVTVDVAEGRITGVFIVRNPEKLAGLAEVLDRAAADPERAAGVAPAM